jgi:acyl-CoA thioesterase-1
MYDPMWGGAKESCYEFWLQKCLALDHSISFNDLVNRGVCGDTSAGIVRRLERELQKNAFGLVILNGGANDLAMGVSTGLVVTNLKRGIQLCESELTPVVTTSVPPINWEPIPQMIAEISEVLRTYSLDRALVGFADVFKALAMPNGFQRPEFGIGDGVHLSVDGYEAMGKAICPAASRFLAESEQEQK